MPEMALSSPRIPLTVIGGFLGAGKTTLVNRILAGIAGIRAAVLVNDFGSVNVDAALVVRHEGETISLANGCVCCSIGGDLSEALDGVMARVPAPQWIVIEASGVADPWRIAQVGLADPGLELDGVVVLVDCAAAPAQFDDPRLHDTMARQIRTADVIVLNKCDLAAESELQDSIARIAPGRPMLSAIHSNVPLQALTSLAPDRAGRGSGNGSQDADHELQFESVSLTCHGRFRAARLRELLARMPEGVLRAKGIVRTDESESEVMQFCGRHGSLRHVESATAEAVGHIVAIGLRGRLPMAQLRAALAAALYEVEA